MTESNSLAPKTRGCRVREVVLSHSLQNPFRSAKYPTFCPGRARRKPHSTAHYARFYHHLQPILWTSTPTHQSKPIAHAPCSGLVQSIFRSPARLRSRFLSAYACCSHAANLKMLCIIERRKKCHAEAPICHGIQQTVARGCQEKINPD